jgi:hypothetical protein
MIKCVIVSPVSPLVFFFFKGNEFISVEQAAFIPRELGTPPATGGAASLHEKHWPKALKQIKT